MKPNRAPNTLWTTRRPGEYPNLYVTTAEGDRIEIAQWLEHPSGSSWRLGALMVSRQQARMLAKRINECLDATVKS